MLWRRILKFREWWPRPYIRHVLFTLPMGRCTKPRQEAGLPPLGSSNCLDAELGLGKKAREGRTETGRVEGRKGG